MSKGKLFLIPNMLGDQAPEAVLPPLVNKIINEVDIYIAENIKTVRRSLIKMGIEQKIDDLTFFLLNKKTETEEALAYLKPILEGKDAAVVSEAGNPSIADPGSLIVKLAHEAGIQVVPVSGPSSVTLALAGSGFNGQQFTFHGYLPIKNPARTQSIKTLERELLKNGFTQIFMETPYRNHQLLEQLLKVCKNDTMLCIGTDLSLDKEQIICKSIADWKKLNINIHKRPSIFLLGK